MGYGLETPGVPTVMAVTLGLHAIPILATCARLWHRKQRKQMWWDDFWVAIALGFLLWVVAHTIAMSYITIEWFSRHPLTESWLVWSAYLASPTTIWLARFSIIVGVVRLVPKGRNRTITKASFFAFVLMWMAIVLGTVTMCGRPQRVPQCYYSRRANAIYLTSNLVSTAWLLTWPVYLLFRMKLKRHERKPILACFLGAISLFAIDIAHATSLLQQERAAATGAPPKWQQAVITGNLQIIVAFLCANSLVLVMYIYRVVRKPGDDRGETSFSSENGDAPETTNTATRNEAPPGSGSTGQFTSIISPLTSIYTGDHAHSFGLSGQSHSGSAASALRMHIANSPESSRLQSMSQFPTLSSRP